MDYNSDFRYDLKIGNKFEEELGKILNDAKLEVKTDFRALDTGNMFIEIESRGKESGIMKSQADYYVYIMSMDYFIFIEKNVLKSMIEYYLEKRGYVRGGDANTSKGVLIPISEITKHISGIKKEL